MTDRIFFAVLTCCLLIVGIGAIGIATRGFDVRGDPIQTAAAKGRVVQLVPVIIVGKRLAPATAVSRTASAEPAAPSVQ
jgi:hypothetical protein